MKKYLLLCAALLALAACKNNQAKDQNTTGVEQVVNAAASGITVENLMENAEVLVDKPVKVTGYVTHVCKHSGRRCFIADEEQTLTIRVEAKGKITSFDKELIGNQIEVNGILRERRLTTAEIEEMESAVAEKREKEEASEEACEAETANIQKMRDWMKDHNKDYYAIYYIDGEEFSEVK